VDANRVARARARNTRSICGTREGVGWKKTNLGVFGKKNLKSPIFVLVPADQELPARLRWVAQSSPDMVRHKRSCRRWRRLDPPEEYRDSDP